MNQLEPFHCVYEELNVFRRNLSKDNAERRLDLSIVRKKISKLEKIKSEFQVVSETFNKGSHEPEIILKAQKYVENIVNKINSIEQSLQDRVDNITSQNSQLSENTMAEKFDLRTAASLIPIMTNKEDTVKNLLDSIELYDSLLDDPGKKLLTTYILKTRLTQSAKLRLKDNYATNQDLITDIKKHCLPQKSATTLAFKLTTAKQSGKSIQDFGSTLEQLFIDLTITQAQGVTANIPILKEANQKLAINSFANGLNNHDLQTIIKARNYDTLSDAIQGAIDENVRSDSQPIFHVRGRGFHRGFNRGHQNTRNNYRGRNQFTHSYNNHGRNIWQNSQNSYSREIRNNTRGIRGQRHTRGNYNNQNFRGNRSNERNVMNVETNNTEQRREETFFRE